MFAEIASMGTLLTLNLFFAGAALVVGLALGAWLFGFSTSGTADDAQNKHRDDELQRAPSGR